MSEMPRIVGLSNPSPGLAVVTFASGECVEILWSEHATAGPVFAGLADPAYADSCEIADWGYALRWPDGMDWSAGAVLEHGRIVVREND